MNERQTDDTDVAALLAAILFAAEKHSSHRRKDSDIPYINHLITVADILARVGHVKDAATLQGAILHDAIEDTQTTPEEIASRFGEQVSAIVQEVTDDKALPKQQRKKLQIQRVPHLSEAAKQIKIADKIHNVADMPASWQSDVQRRKDYLDWAEKVVAGCRGCNPDLDHEFDATLKREREMLGPTAEQETGGDK